MKEKDTNKADREFLDVYLGETHPQEAEPSGQSVHAESALTPKRISAKMRRGTLEAYKQTFLVPAKLTSWSASCAPIWKTTPRKSRNGESCNPSIRIHQRVHERYAYLTSSNRLNAWHAVIVRNTAGT